MKSSCALRLGILVEESGKLKQEEGENSPLEFYLDTEMGKPFILEKGAEVLKITSDAELVSVCVHLKTSMSRELPES